MDRKNTFVFNLEWAAVLSVYPAEVRLEVYEAIFRYASTGTLPTLKPLAKMAFSFIRKEMDYNRERYEAVSEKRREAGRKGAEITNNKIRQNSANGGKFQQNSANSGYNDNDNDNDNELSSTTTRAREGAVGDDDGFLERFFCDKVTVDAFCRDNGLSPDKFRTLAREIVTEWRLTAHTHVSEQDARRHLISQTRKKLQAHDTKPSDRYSRYRGSDSEALSPEDYTDSL